MIAQESVPENRFASLRSLLPFFLTCTIKSDSALIEQPFVIPVGVFSFFASLVSNTGFQAAGKLWLEIMENLLLLES